MSGLRMLCPLVLAGVTAACGSSASSPVATTITVPSSTVLPSSATETSTVPAGSKATTVGATPGESVMSLLGAVAASDGRTTLVKISDLARVRTWARAATGAEEVRLLRLALADRVDLPDPIGPNVLREDLGQLVGFDLRDVEGAVQWGSLPSEVTSVFVGRFDVAAVTAALQALRSSVPPVTTTRGSWTLISLGDEGKVDMNSVSPVRPVGQSVRVAVRSDELIWARTQTALDAAIATSADAGSSLATDSVVAAVGAALDQHGAWFAGIAFTEWSGAGWDVAGLGETVTGGAAKLTVALHFPSAAAASSAGEELRSMVASGTSATKQPWSSLLTADSIDVTNSLVVGVLTATRPGLASRILDVRDTLLDIG